VPVTLVVRSAHPRSGEPALAPHAPLTFDAPRVLLGRGASCELRLPDASVSVRHCSVRAANAGYVVVDEGSTNGTTLNDEKLSAHAPRPLKTGDVLQLGRLSIEVRIGAAVASTTQATRELALDLVKRRLGDPSASIVHVRVIEGPDAGRSLAIETINPTLGRDPRCALRLTDRGIPPIALEITRDAGRVRVARKDERVPATLGDRALDVGAPSVWNDRAKLVVASTTLELDDPLTRALDASAQGDDEKFAPAPAAEPTPGPAPAPAPSPAASDTKSPEIPDRILVRAPAYDRRRSWRGATLAFEIVALILGLLVLGGSAAGLWWLLHK
jgi:predicted component of type VI protein secretion system